MAATARTDELRLEIERLSRRDLQLWLLGLLVMLVLAAGVVALLLPNLMWRNESLRIESQYLPQLFFGFIAIVVLFNVYVLQQHAELNHARRATIQQQMINEKLQAVSFLDPLTQAFNRRYLDHVLPREVTRANRTGSCLSLLFLDVHGTAGVNSRAGTAVGDRLLMDVAQVLARTFRGSDVVLRYGGDEFLVLMPDTNEQQAEKAQARLLREIDLWNENVGSEQRIELILATACYREGRDIAELLRWVEQEAKRQKQARTDGSQRKEQQPSCLMVSTSGEVNEKLRPVLESMGVSVQEIATAQAALNKVAQQRYEAVIIDVEDVSGGPSLIRKIRTTSLVKNAIIIAAVDTERHPHVGFRMGANFVVDKPIVPDRASRNLRAAYTLMVGERRRYFRYAISIPVIVTLADGNVHHVSTTNISEGGMALHTPERLKIGSAARLRFTLPGTSTAIECKAEVAWADDKGKAGVKFQHASVESKQVLEQWLAEKWREEAGLPARVGAST